MALGTLAELRSAALATRPDLTARFPDFVALAEQMIYVGDGRFEPLRVRELEHSAEITITDGVASLPADYLDKRALIWSSSIATFDVPYEAPATFYGNERNRAGVSVPMAYTVEGTTLKLASEATGTATLLYHRRLTTPVADGSTNAVLTSYPSIYLRGVEVEIARAVRNDGELAKALDALAGAIAAANMASKTSRFSGGTLRKRAGMVSV